MLNITSILSQIQKLFGIFSGALDAGLAGNEELVKDRDMKLTDSATVIQSQDFLKPC